MTKYITLTLCLCIILSGCTPETTRSQVVSGKIVDGQGVGVSGVKIIAPRTGTVALSNEDGTWGLGPVDSRVTITPSKDGNVFFPSTLTVAVGAGNIRFEMVTTITGRAVADREQARAWLKARAPAFTHIVDLYYDIAPIYNIRADVALAQATHETNYFNFGGIVEAWQNNFAGIGATGVASDGATPLRDADPALVRFQRGLHGAIFLTPAAGVEAHIQHLYAYATSLPLPFGRPLLSPRYTLVRRGTAPYVEYLGARQNPAGVGWATDATYGFKIVRNHLERMLTYE